MVDAKDLKSFEGNLVPVRVRPPAPVFAYPGLQARHATPGAAIFARHRPLVVSSVEPCGYLKYFYLIYLNLYEINHSRSLINCQSC